MQLLSELVEQVCEPLSVLPRQVSTLPVYRNFFQLEVTLLQHKEESMPLLETCTRMIGDGTCTIL